MNPFKFKRITMLGLRSLADHKLRSLLTALGMIFGVGSVISMLAIGEGANYEAQQQLRQLGSRNIIIRAQKPPETASAGEEAKRMSIYGLTYADARRIDGLFPEVARLVPARLLEDRVRNGSTRLPVQVVGTLSGYLDNTGLEVQEGRFLAAADQRHAANVCVLPAHLARQLFPLASSLGQSVYLGGQAYRVVGTVEAPALGKIEQPDLRRPRVFIPLAAARDRFGETIVKRETGSQTLEQVELHELIVQADSEAAVLPLAKALEHLLAHFHPVRDYELVIPLELLRQAEKTQRVFTIVLGSIAAISLLVGGIGIMNIMLASVTERTREIGIRRALGATRRDIVWQFLAEALLLSLSGGLIGMGLGVVIPQLVSRVTKMQTLVTPDALVLSFGISVAAGLVFGLYPAARAAQMSPIEALRHE